MPKTAAVVIVFGPMHRGPPPIDRGSRALLLGCALLLASCVTYTEELNRGQRYFQANEYERALAVWRVLESDIDSLSPVDRTRYAYLRGMTDYRMSLRADARHWLALARSYLLGGRALEAAKIFDRIAQADGASEIAPIALFNAGVSWEQAGDRDAALVRFRSTADRYPAGDVGKWAIIRSVRIHAYLEQWSQLSAMSDLLLSRPDLIDIEKLEALGAKALAVVEAGDADAAEKLIAKGRDIVELLRLGEGGKLPLEVAQIHFALGEVRKLRSESITFAPMPPNFADALERRCQGLLDAQSAYSDAMRSYDAHWAAMSGYRVGELYQRLHRDVMSIPPPRTAGTTADKR